MRTRCTVTPGHAGTQVFWPPLRPLASSGEASTGDRKATRVRNYMARVIQRFWRRTIPKLWVFSRSCLTTLFHAPHAQRPHPPPITPLPPLSPAFASLSLSQRLPSRPHSDDESDPPHDTRCCQAAEQIPWSSVGTRPVHWSHVVLTGFATQSTRHLV